MRWNSDPAEKYTRVVAANAAHCQYVNCNAGIIDTSITGSDTTADHTMVHKRVSRSGSEGASASGSSASVNVNAS